MAARDVVTNSTLSSSVETQIETSLLDQGTGVPIAVTRRAAVSAAVESTEDPIQAMSEAIDAALSNTGSAIFLVDESGEPLVGANGKAIQISPEELAALQAENLVRLMATNEGISLETPASTFAQEPVVEDSISPVAGLGDESDVVREAERIVEAHSRRLVLSQD